MESSLPSPSKRCRWSQPPGAPTAPRVADEEGGLWGGLSVPGMQPSSPGPVPGVGTDHVHLGNAAFTDTCRALERVVTS